MKKTASLVLAIFVVAAGVALGLYVWHATTHHHVTLTWQSPTSSENTAVPLRYNVYRSDDLGQSFLVLARRLSQTTFEDFPVKGGRTYLYSVTTLDERGHESLRSEQIRVAIR